MQQRRDERGEPLKSTHIIDFFNRKAPPAAKGAKPVSYEGERDASSIAQWVKKNAKSL